MRVRAALFGLLVVASAAAFFVAQRIKSSPSTIQRVLHPRLISPNGDGRKDTIGFTLRLKETDHVTLTILDSDGDPVRRILDDRRLQAYRVLDGSQVRWDGRDERGRVVPDGLYRLRITLRDQGRSVVDTSSITVDTVPPRPTIARVEPAQAGAPATLPLPGDRPVTAHFKRARSGASIAVFQTSPRRRRVLSAPLDPLQTSWTWDGREAGGGRAPTGTYVIVARWRDRADNVGTSVPLDAAGLPAVRGRYPGRGGVTVSYAAVSPPAAAVRAGGQATFGVDTRGRAYRWTLRRAGGRTIKGGRADRDPLTLNIPRARSGLYELVVTAGTHSASAPFAVLGTRRTVGSRADPAGVLVLVPTITWQGRAPVDDDGDGAVNLLDRGAAVRAVRGDGRMRPLGGRGLPSGLGTREGALFDWLDRGRDYDVATDLELERRPRLLDGYRGVLIAGDARWLTAPQQTRLRRFVQRGGTLMSVGTESLRRSVRLRDDGVLAGPTAAAASDTFGASIGRVQRQPTSVEAFGRDAVGLFSRTPGSIPGVIGWEPTRSVGTSAELVAGGVTDTTTTPAGQTVTVAVRYGRGLVIRPGFTAFSGRLREAAVAGLMERSWELLSR